MDGLILAAMQQLLKLLSCVSLEAQSHIPVI
jgi:hypothetical protein